MVSARNRSSFVRADKAALYRTQFCSGQYIHNIEKLRPYIACFKDFIGTLCRIQLRYSKEYFSIVFFLNRSGEKHVPNMLNVANDAHIPVKIEHFGDDGD